MLGTCIEQIDGSTCGYYAKSDIHINVCHPMYHTYFPRSDATYGQPRCRFPLITGEVCNEPKDSLIHDQVKTTKWHIFTPKEDAVPGIRTQITKAMLYTPGTLTVDVMNIFMRDLPGDATLEIEKETHWETHNLVQRHVVQNRLVATYWIGGK